MRENIQEARAPSAIIALTQDELDLLRWAMQIVAVFALGTVKLSLDHGERLEHALRYDEATRFNERLAKIKL